MKIYGAETRLANLRMLRWHAPRRDATQRTAFNVNTLSLFNVFDYCVAVLAEPQ